MTKLIYVTNVSLDGYIEDERGAFDWFPIDDQLKATASSDLTVGGANLATQAFKARLVNECQLLILPIVVGGGKPGLPTGMRAYLELLDERRFRNGVAYLRYRPLGQ